MAYFNRNRQSGEHPSKTVVKMVKDGLARGSWPKVILLTGAEDFLVDWSLKYIKDSVIDPITAALDCTVFDPDETSADDIIAACESYPMMSQRKVVCIAGADFFSGSPKQLSSEDIQALAEYIPRLSESTMLIFTAASTDKRKALYKAVEKNGIIYDFTPLDDNMLSAWMQKRMSAEGCRCTSSDLIRFANACNYGTEYNLYNLENDIKKAALSGGPNLTYEDLMSAAGVRSTDDAFALLDAAFSGRKGQALTILHTAADAQTPSKVQGVILSFLGLLCSQLEIMLEARERKDEGQSFSQIQSAMGVNEYRLKKAMEACGSRNTNQLREKLKDAYNIDKMMRNGEMDPYLAMEVFIATL